MFKAYLSFDDNTPADLKPFSHDPSIWSLAEDYGLNTCGDSNFFAALGFDFTAAGYENVTHAAPLYPLHGKPMFIAQASEVRRLLELEDYVGWLEQEELFAALQHHEISEMTLSRPVRVLLGAVRYLTSTFGPDRVRLLFAFIP